LHFTQGSCDNKRIINLADYFSDADIRQATVTPLENGRFMIKLSHSESRTSHEITLDKNIQYMATRISNVTPSIHRNYDVDFLDYRTVGGVMIPFEIKRESGWTLPEVTHKDISHIKIKSLVVNDKKIENEIKLVFPEKLTVHDNIEGVTYEVGSGGGKKNVRKIELMQVMPSQPNPQKQQDLSGTTLGQVETPSYQTYGWLLPVSFGVLAITAIAVYVQRKRSR
jgi:hypothetical protein